MDTKTVRLPFQPMPHWAIIRWNLVKVSLNVQKLLKVRGCVFMPVILSRLLLKLVMVTLGNERSQTPLRMAVSELLTIDY